MTKEQLIEELELESMGLSPYRKPPKPTTRQAADRYALHEEQEKTLLNSEWRQKQRERKRA